MRKGGFSDNSVFQNTMQSGQVPGKCSFINGSYKDQEAFRHSRDDPCYIPDTAGRCYTGEELLEMSLGQKEIAEEMFLSIAGQDPEAWLDEQFRIRELAICPVCGRIYQSYIEKRCPLCKK
ncbi:MAG: hypothetical protein LBT06_01175 [Hungatella sp.]|jgi:hypothetical protein|nr:hypothetical protein [Hungatella sp.]